VLVGKADTVAQRQAAPVAAIDSDEGAWVSTQGDHLLEDRKEHQLSQRDLPSLGQPHECAAGSQGDCHDLRVADIGLKRRLDVMGADDENVPVLAGPNQHPAVEARRRGQVASRQGTPGLRLDRVLPRCPRAAAKGIEQG